MATKNGIIQSGDQDGIIVKADVDNNRYSVEMPNKYDLTHAYSKYGKGEYVPNPNAVDKSNNVIYYTPPIFEMDEKAQKQFMMDVSRSRNVNRELMTEREIFTTAIEFDSSPQKITFTGIPLKAKRDANNEIIKNDSGKVQKEPGYVKGEIMAVGKYYVAIKNEFNNTPDSAVVHLIETSKFLNLEDYKQPDRFAQVLKKLDLDPAKDMDGDEVKKGIKRYMAFTEKGLAKDIKKTYSKEVKQEPTKETTKTKTKQKQPEMTM